MNTLRVLVLLWLASGPGVVSQTPSPERPTEPIVRRAPANASWTITFAYAEELAKVSPDKPPVVLTDRIKSVVVTKTAPTYREQATWRSGKTEEKWVLDNVQLRTIAGRNTVVPVPPPLRDLENPGQFLRDPNYSDYSQFDFSGLEWVGLGNFQGIKKLEGKPAYFFESINAGRTLTAYLAIDTQLPLCSSDGSTTRLYVHNPAPAAPLVPPANFSNALDAYKKGVSALTRRPVR